MTFFPPFSLQPGRVLPIEWDKFNPNNDVDIQEPYVAGDTGWLMIECGWNDGAGMSTSLLTWGYENPVGPWYPFTAPAASITFCMTDYFVNDAQILIVTAYEEPWETGATTSNSLTLAINPVSNQVSFEWFLGSASYGWLNGGTINASFDAGDLDAWFRIRWESDLVGVAEVSPDGETWTELGRSPVPVPVELGIVQMSARANSVFGVVDQVHSAVIKELIITGESVGGYKIAVGDAWVPATHKIASSSSWGSGTYSVL